MNLPRDEATIKAPRGSLTRRAMTLGGSNAFDYAMQFLLPVVLVRYLSGDDFGQYRLLWLAITTVTGVLPLAMPQALYYFLPRSDRDERRLYVHQTLLFLVLAGVLGGWLISAANPLQPPAIADLNRFGWIAPALLAAWCITKLLDMLPTIDERVEWQAAMTMGLAALRTVSLAAGAWLTQDLTVLIWLLLAITLFKIVLLLHYIARMHGLGGSWFGWRQIVDQFRHAAPFGISSSLFILRSQADQWVAATLFAVHSFAAFTIAAVLGPMINLCRMSVNHAFLPEMSRLQAAGDVGGMLALNSRANAMVGRLVFPFLAIAFVFAEEMVTVVYTANYLEAAAVMRVYIFGFAVLVVELFSITFLLREGAFALRLNLWMLAASIAVSWGGAKLFGLPGAAVGSAAVLFLDRFATLQRIAARVGIPIRRLQDWRTLGMQAVFAFAGGLAAWAASHEYLGDSRPLIRLIAGTLVVLAVYAALYGLFGGGARSGLLPADEWKT